MSSGPAALSIPRRSKRKRVSVQTITTTRNTPLKITAPPAPKRIRGRKGALKKFPEMPIDILLQVFNHLHPLDLLYLSRANKAFRSLLMVRRSAYIWKDARKNVPGLPEPLQEMSESAFAALCFEPVCTFCHKSGRPEVIWEFRARFCKECKKSRVSPAYERALVMDGQYTIELPQITAKTRIRTQHMVVKFIPESLRLKEEWIQLTDADGRQRFIKECKTRIQILKKAAGRCERWSSSVKRDRANELKALREQRYDSIRANLVSMGYGKDIRWSEERLYGLKARAKLEYLPCVRQAKPLTERGWERICADLIKHMEKRIQPLRMKSKY